jgi:hypothetical protein
MKLIAALVALAAAVAAPLASADPVCDTASNELVLGNLTATSTIRKTTVIGGSRIVQKIAIKNNAGAAAQNLTFASDFDDEYVTFVKGNARILGSKKPTISAEDTTVSSSTFSIPAGKTLKATIMYKAVRCPTSTDPTELGDLVVSVASDDDDDCKITKEPTDVRPEHLSILYPNPTRSKPPGRMYVTDLSNPSNAANCITYNGTGQDQRAQALHEEELIGLVTQLGSKYQKRGPAKRSQ